MRWSDASTITLLTGQPDLPDAWWRSLPMPRVLAAIGPESLGELLTEIALEHWPAAAVGDVLPALHVLDPDEADEPAVAIALDRAGSWAGLLSLTSRELVDQPFIQARPVLNTLFAAVLVRLAPARAAASEPAVAAAPVAVAEPVEAVEPAEVAEPVEVVEPEPVALEEPGEVAEVEDQAPAEVEPVAEQEPEPEPAPEPEPDLEPEPEPVVAGVSEVAEFAVVEVPEEPEPAAPESAGIEEQEPAAVAADEPEFEPIEAHEHAPEPIVAEEQEAHEPVFEAFGTPETPEVPEAPEVAEVPEAAEALEVAEEPTPELPALIEAAFSGLDDKTWAVAQNRVFTDQPSAVDQLAKLFAVPPAEIAATEHDLRTRVDQWLASDEAAPYRAHLDELRAAFGPHASKEQLIGAADWHAREIQALEVPAWQFVLATLAAPTPAEQAPPVQQAPIMEQHNVHPQGAHPYAAPPPNVPPAFPPPTEFPPPVGYPPPIEQVPSAFGPLPAPPPPMSGPPQFQAFAPAVPVSPPPVSESNGGGPVEPSDDKPYQPLKDVSQTRRCFRQPDGRWWLRIDVTAEQLTGGECPLPTGFAAYLGLAPGETKTVRSAAGELTMSWHGRPTLESVERLLADVGAREGGHLFLTLSDEGVLRARHLPVAAQGAEKITKALRLVGYTAPGGTKDQAARVIATRIGMTGPVGLPDLLTRLRERGDRDLLALLD
ncbi:hypothetical protein HII36_28880 [Nonomuraea sp. NN258]|uniref:hypothetical protein n=1 Tax=Nonomuraea antri TaxID=2730852 RepID=UPI0015681428|nr:hypothetical protein [Nonomuraea antri]NRQ35819.1 hypothetical protein [Nonomuraea antri]